MASDGHDNFLHTLNCLLDMKIVPVLNANDVHSPPPQKNSDLKDVMLGAVLIFHPIDNECSLTAGGEYP